MRTVAAYALEDRSGSQLSRVGEVTTTITEWLIEKGWEGTFGQDFRSVQGHKARALMTEVNTTSGQLHRYAIFEELTEAIFATEIAVASRDGDCSVFVQLRLAGTDPRVQPFRFDARRPKFLAKLLHGGLNWHLGETPLTDRAYSFEGAADGRRIVEMIWHEERSVPAILVSLIQGSAVTPDFVAKLAGDLAGLAIVATVDEEASWAITKAKGSEWSCFGGAVRLYWPLGGVGAQSKLHPFWRRETIESGADDASSASYRMRAQLRRRILGVSAFSVREPSLIRELTRAARQQRQEELLAALKASESPDEYRAIAESYAEENDRLRDEIRDKEDRVSALEGQLSELQLALRYYPQDDTEVSPDVEDEPKSVSEAVDLARERLSGRLLFSDSISDGVLGLHPEAGPPAKVLRYLKVLHDLADARASGGLGVGVVPWLADRGVSCSVESETVRNTESRQWVVAGRRINFDLHLKPSEGVSPDRCVRIYFDLHENRVRIGWIGRHPD